MEEDAFKELSLRCNVCKGFVSLPSVRDHKKHHHAMRIMRFKEGKGPRSIDSLSKRHMTLLRKVLSKYKDSPDDSNLLKRIEKINEAYETLRFEFTKDDAELRSMLLQDGKTSMRDGYFEDRDKVQDDQVESESIGTYNQTGFPICVYGIGRAQAVNRDWRDQMEDSSSIKGAMNVPSMDNSCYIGLFDGYHGAAASKSCAEKMDTFLLQEVSEHRKNLDTKWQDKNENQYGILSTEVETEEPAQKLSDFDVMQCTTKAYAKMDHYLGYGIGETSRVRWSGCSALTCLIADESQMPTVNEKGDAPTGEMENRKIVEESDKILLKTRKIGRAYVSNAGNVKAVLYHKKKPHLLTRNHTLDNTEEHNRVIEAGGSVNSSERYPKLNGILETTRGLGNHGDTELKKCVLTSPHTSVAKLTGESQILVLATNSLWEVLNPNDVFSILVHSIPPDAMTVLKSGPIPIIPVIHGRSGKKGDSDGHHLSSTLPSIVETEEDDGIEEVIFVHAEHSDSEDEEESKQILKDGTGIHSTASVGGGYSSDSSLVVNKTEGKTPRNFGEDVPSFDGSVSSFSVEESLIGSAADAALIKESNARQKYAQVAHVLSAQLVRAAIAAGAVENVSVVVVVFKGLFDS